jgi:hypothetical protein
LEDFLLPGMSSTLLHKYHPQYQMEQWVFEPLQQQLDSQSQLGTPARGAVAGATGASEITTCDLSLILL